jgi:hypothetical protein
MENPMRPYFGAHARSGSGSSRAEIVRVISDVEEAYWMGRYEKVNLRVDPSDPAFGRATPIRIVEEAPLGSTAKLIRFSESWDDFRSRYRDVRVVAFPP